MPRDRHLASVPSEPTRDFGNRDLPTLPSHRRPRRAEAARYRIRVELAGTEPVLWRRVELASDLFLDEVHDAIQLAVGWTDSHLHGFASGAEYHSPAAERYLCPFELEDAGPGVPEEDVRLDEVLANPGDRLFYLYDFGDSWEHVIELESTALRDDAAPRAVCLDAQGDAPPEDCGGLGGYELVSAAADPRHRDHRHAVAEFLQMYGIEFNAADHGPAPFRLDAVNAALAHRFPAGPQPERRYPPDDLPAPLGELLAAVGDGYARRELRWLIGSALDADARPDVDTATATRMVRPYAWLLGRVGDEGIRLTGAGYLPPAQVEAAVKELDLLEDWMGKGNREVQTLPLLWLREAATKMGLLRKQRGILQLTAAGQRLRADPVALWWHLAERMPLKTSDRCETQAGLIWLLAVAAHPDCNPGQFVASMLNRLGWRLSSGESLDPRDAARAAQRTRGVLLRLGCLTGDPRRYGQETLNADGAIFTRAAAATWPGLNG
jgi:Plasmid pRiA4b ORF-3-like protein